jgi:hypothetical protein
VVFSILDNRFVVEEYLNGREVSMNLLNSQRARRVLVLGGIFLAVQTLYSGNPNSAGAAPLSGSSVQFQLMMPIIRQGWPPLPEIPVLNAIENSD